MRLGIVGAMLLIGGGLSATAASPAELDRVRELRLHGALAEARSLAEEALAEDELSVEERIEFHLELARIHDRVGLHQNSRPVVEALHQIEAAAAATDSPTPLARARIELARAEYHYRAETPEGEFPRTSAHAERALELFQELGDTRGQADATHRLGLIHLQRRELDAARALFDRSLELEKAGEPRSLFLADYERHVGFVFVLAGETVASVSYFERSLALRRKAGAVDQSLFAARALGGALVDVGRLEEARGHLLYGLLVADRLDSPVGWSRIGLTLGELYEKLGDIPAARLAYEATLDVAEAVEYTSITDRAKAALERLAEESAR